ncbi:hypothetical protein SNE32_16350, partial [Lysobacter sp. D1-1-M9]
DETARLLGSLKRMQGELRRFSDAQMEMALRHEEGDIDHRMASGEFHGAYGHMAEGVNTLVDSHLQVNYRLLALVNAYGRGDLSQDMERLPGKKAEITAAMDAVKAGMLEVNAEIKQLVDAAVAGDFSRRGDAGRFEFVYREMIGTLNELMASSDRGL